MKKRISKSLSLILSAILIFTMFAGVAAAGKDIELPVVDIGEWVTTEKVVITKQPVDAAADAGKTVKFTVEAKCKDGSNPSYQWQCRKTEDSDWVNSGLSGNKTAVLKLSATSARNGYAFRCVVTGQDDETVISEEASLKVWGDIKVLSQPMDQEITKGGNAKFTVSAESVNEGELSYQWMVSTDGGENFKASGLTGNKTKTLTVPATAGRSGYMFYCLITDSKGKTETSDEASLTVKSQSAGTVKITSTTVSQGALTGTVVKYSVAAKTSTGTDLTYRWYASTDGGKTWNPSGLAGNKTKTLKVSATSGRDGYMFYCLVSDGAGNSECSDAVKLTVK